MTMHVRSNFIKFQSPVSPVELQAGQQQSLPMSSGSNYDNIFQNNQLFRTITSVSCAVESTHKKNKTFSVKHEDMCTRNNSETFNSWVFPPKGPSPQIYNWVNNDAFISTGQKNGFKGFRKQFSGRFKRLVTTKKKEPSAIPPELKPQLKTIYVY